jgi:hypothetical protein
MSALLLPRAATDQNDQPGMRTMTHKLQEVVAVTGEQYHCLLNGIFKNVVIFAVGRYDFSKLDDRVGFGSKHASHFRRDIMIEEESHPD